MTVRELNIGDVFRVVGEEKLWRKRSPGRADRVGELTDLDRYFPTADLADFAGKAVQVVEKADTADIRRMGRALVLRGGEVTLDYTGAYAVYRCAPGERFGELVLTARSFSGSAAPRPTADTALCFCITLGSKHLNRPIGSELFAHGGRVYGRATKREVLGQSGAGSYKVVREIDGAKRLCLAVVLTIPGEFALYDIIMEHFGPDAVPHPQAE